MPKKGGKTAKGKGSLGKALQNRRKQDKAKLRQQSAG